MCDWRGTFSVLDEKQLLILFFSVQSAVGSTLAVQQWKMLNPPFSGSSVARHSLRDRRPAVRTGMKWQRLAGVSLWCSLATVQVMPCGPCLCHVNSNCTRGPSLFYSDYRSNARTHSFSVRIVSFGNRVPAPTVLSCSLQSFRNSIEQIDFSYALIGKD